MQSFLKYIIPIQMGGQNKWLCPYSYVGWLAAAGILLGYIFIEKNLTGALLGFFIGGILGETISFFRKKLNQ